VFFRLIVFSMVGTAGFYWALLHYSNLNLMPGWIFLGAFGIPFAVLVFFMEVNVLRNVSFYRVLKLFMLGGLLSLIFTLALNDLTGLEFLGPVSAGAIEEPAKLLAVVFFTRRWRNMDWTLNGMLFGAAVGAGFAAFETAGYILRALLEVFTTGVDIGFAVERVMFGRAFFAPFMHVIWTAATAAAFWRAKGDREFSFALFGEWRFLRVLLLMVGIHSIWNCAWGGYPKYVALGGIGWVLVLLLLHDALDQVRKAKDVSNVVEGREPGVGQEEIFSELNATEVLVSQSLNPSPNP
jgi:RsiW-degrading membrane proteinase PrsW (M82 family)